MARPRAETVPAELSVGEVATRTGLAVSAIHFYEREGLITSHRSAGNQRRFGRTVLRRIAVIKAAQVVGIPLIRIKAALATLPDNRVPTDVDWRRFSRGWRAELDYRILLLTRLRDQLDKCIGCGCLSLKACPLYNNNDKQAKRGPGAHFLMPKSPR